LTRIALTDEEMLSCVTAGGARTINALSKGRRGAHGFNRDFERWQLDIEGVMCEAAAAKALGLTYSPTVGRLDTDLGDIGPGLQVRGTKYSTGSLLIHDTDNDRDRFILVTGIYGVYDIRGWIYAEHGKSERLWKMYKGRGAYWIPQDMLQPIEKLDLANAA
jgi:hypothetical protein